MSRDKKRQMVWYQLDDTAAIARHLEKMAAKGWLLESVDNWWYTYRRAEPVQVKYTATFFPDASIYDPRITEGQETYADYCQAAGWELAAAYGPIQYFRSTRPDPAPIETDEAVKLTDIRRTMRKTFVLSHILLLALPLISLPSLLRQIKWGPMSFFSSNLSLGSLLLMAALALYGGGFLLDYLVWVLRSRYSVAHGGACVRPHTRARLWAGWAMLAICAAVVLGYFTERSLTGMRSVFLIFLVIYGGMMLLSRWVLRRLKSKGVSRGSTRGVMIGLAVVLGLAVGFGSVFLFSRMADAGIIRMGREPAGTYTYTNGKFSITHDVYRDELPVTLEDLGYAVTPEDHCTYEAETDRSPLAVHTEYTQAPLNLDSGLPRLYYQTYETSWPWLLEKCWEGLIAELEERYEPSPVRELDPAPWGAVEACQGTGDAAYLLRYPDRIVTFGLRDGATWQRLDAIAQALRP